MTKLTLEYKKMLKNYSKEKINDVFTDACRDGDLELIRYVLTSPDLMYLADIHIDDDDGLILAALNKHLHVVKYLLSSVELDEHADIHAECNESLFWACSNGDMEMIKYLLTSSDLKEHANLNVQGGRALSAACRVGNLEVVKYLLTSPDLKEHADIHAENDVSFEYACEKEKISIVEYLLSFSDDKRIDFQNTYFNLSWAFEKQYDDVIIAMMKSLFIYDPIQYFEHLYFVENYNSELCEKLKKAIDNLSIHPHCEINLHMC